MRVLSALLLAAVCSIAFSEEDEIFESDPKDAYKAIVESCSGWQLNKYPEVRDFINKDLPLFHNAERENKHGAPPNLIFYNLEGHEIERILLSGRSRDECNDFLLNRGFYKKTSQGESVPDEYLQGPYRSREEL